MVLINPFELHMTRTTVSFGYSECTSVKQLSCTQQKGYIQDRKMTVYGQFSVLIYIFVSVHHFGDSSLLLYTKIKTVNEQCFKEVYMSADV